MKKQGAVERQRQNQKVLEFKIDFEVNHKARSDKRE